jgi:hypothetical protein
MMKISMDMNVTTMRDLGGGTVQVGTCKYKDLENVLREDDIIQVDYAYGKEKTRRNTLAKLGFQLKDTIYHNNEALHSRIKEIWERAAQ